MAQQPEPEPELKLSPASSSPPPPPPGRDWFSSLFGFSEAEESVIKYGLARPAVAPHANVWRHLELIRGGGGAGGGQRLRSRVNGMEYGVGEFGCPSLRELREDMGVVKALSAAAAAAATCCGAAGTAAAVKGRATTGALTLHVDTGVDAAALHGAFRNAGATFQVASQFNCLEFPGPSTTPEDGVTNYAHDRTQGPACAIAAGPATVFRNYFVEGSEPLGLPPGQRGQTREAMIDNLAALSEALGNGDGSLLDCRGGYTTSRGDGALRRLGQRIGGATAAEREVLRGLLRVGVHADVEVTATEWGRRPVGRHSFEGERPHGHTVTQVLCSACSLDYGQRQGGLLLFGRSMPLAASRARLWEPLARLVLEAAYEATLLAALRQGSKVVFLTLLGGGVFKNDVGWIVDAIARALELVRHCCLEVHIVCYESRAHPLVTKLLEKVESGAFPLAPVRLTSPS